MFMLQNKIGSGTEFLKISHNDNGKRQRTEILKIFA